MSISSVERSRLFHVALKLVARWAKVDEGHDSRRMIAPNALTIYGSF